MFRIAAEAGGIVTNKMNSTDTLESLNFQAARVYFGFIIFICVIFLPAVIGNAHILHIYIRKKKQNNTRVYVCFIAVLDMINCTVCYPYMVVNCMLPYMFYSDAACKIFTFITYFTNVCVSWSLLIISVDRFRVICRPFGAQISLRLSQMLCVLCTILAAVCSAPSVFIAESIPIDTGNDDIVGYECNSAFNEKTWTKVYTGMFSILTIIGAIALIVLYSLMGIAIHKQAKLIRNSGMHLHSASMSDISVIGDRRRTLSNSTRLSSECEHENQTFDDINKNANHSNANQSDKTISYNQIESGNTNTVRQEKFSFVLHRPSIPNISTKTTRRHSFSFGDGRNFGPNVDPNLVKSNSIPTIDWNNNNHSELESSRNLDFIKAPNTLRDTLTVPTLSRDSYLNGGNLDKSPQSSTETLRIPSTSETKDSDDTSSFRSRSSSTGRYEKYSDRSSYDGIHRHKASITRRLKRYVKQGSMVLRRSTKKRQNQDNERFKRTKRTTIMFFWVTFVFLVSFLPNPALRVARYLYPDWYAGLSLTEMNIFNLFHGSIFLVSATNFFIYLFCDSMFRGEVKLWYKNVFCRRLKSKTIK